MNFADIIVGGVIIALLALVFYFTRPKKGKPKGCGGCSSDCSSCHAFSNFYEDYKQEEEQHNSTE